MKAKARKVARDSWGFRVDLGMSLEEVTAFQKRAEKWADHLAKCSCMGCGHQRHHWGLTVQERRHIDGPYA